MPPYKHRPFAMPEEQAEEHARLAGTFWNSIAGPREPDVPRWMLYTVDDADAEIMLRRSTGGSGIFVSDICEVHSLADSWYPASPLESVWMVQTTDGFHSLINLMTQKWVPFEEIQSIEVRRVAREVVATDPRIPSCLRM